MRMSTLSFVINNVANSLKNWYSILLSEIAECSETW